MIPKLREVFFTVLEEVEKKLYFDEIHYSNGVWCLGNSYSIKKISQYRQFLRQVEGFDLKL
jgi:hypothetical protein